MGAVSHHYFAGYGGGRKLIFPGCGEREAIYANHGLYLDGAAGTIAAGCRPGVLDGNPLADDLFEIEEKLPVRSGHSRHSRFPWRSLQSCLSAAEGKTFLEACRLHGENCEISRSWF